MTSILSPYQRPGHLPIRRTNSLAFAKSDCHTCASLGLHCDRHRPRCSQCQDAGRLCQGYSMQLTWQRNHSTANKPPKVKAIVSQAGNSTLAQPRDDKKAGQSPDSRGASNAPAAPREFTFVAGRPAKRRKKHHRAAETAEVEDDAFNVGEPENSRSSESSQGLTRALLSPAEFRRSADLMPKTPSLAQARDFPAGVWPPPTLLDSEIVPEVQNIHSPDSESLEQCLQIQQYTDSPGAWSHPTTSGNTTDSWSEGGYVSESEYIYQTSLSHIPQIRFATLHDKFSGLLNMYDVQFCKYPITDDFGVNPYRYRPETTKGSRHLLHSILAISSHFRLRSPTQPTPPAEALEHKNTAMVLYQSALTETDLYKNGLSLLDTALALWQLEATISALNIWRSHLTDALNLLELCGGPEKWSLSKRANVQVSMVLWWDAIVALLARAECILPYVYLEAVLRHEGRQPWTFYELNGCPRELFVPMTQLANLTAREQDETAALLVSEIEQSLKRYEYPGAGRGLYLDTDTDADSDAEDEDEEAMHLERDKYHCCEGFRYALLIYILRVFKTSKQTLRHTHAHAHKTHKRQTAHPRPAQSRISYLSRVCLDHVAACRSTSLIQKQLLFPVFIAGCETRNLTHREFAAEYCRRWFRKFGYQMYMTVLDVMEAVWTEQDTGNEDFWWGDELDARRAREGEYVQFCFG
ncbi:hypothetical protein PV04_06132 [Phialophora macrospora]|uniref:Zn(2)-C6 fungal-type domain-containing protein n=1 Tax=Phialophora macrospora TaxID=1851006 RepID=A0A0D2FFK6_9EURO|nr:hypothetical protein PV04_06132 [Phialophora macrospora]